MADRESSNQDGMSWWETRVVDRTRHLLIPVITVLWAASTLSWIILVVTAFVLFRGGLYLIEASTSRLEYEVTDPERSRIFLNGALVSTEKGFVQESGGDLLAEDILKQGFCVFGYIVPAQGATLEFDIYQGAQLLTISKTRAEDARNASKGADKTAGDAAPSEGRTPESGSSSQSGDAASDRAIVATLEQSEKSYIVYDFAAPPVTDSNGEGSNDGAAQDLSLVLGQPPLPLEGFVEVTEDPGCHPDRSKDGLLGVFAPRSDPVYIGGPGLLGREVVVTEQGRQIARDPLTYTKGAISVIIRETLCLGRLYGQPCSRIFNPEVPPMPIPAGASVWGLSDFADKNSRSYLQGQLFFDDGLYTVSLSTAAQGFSVLLPNSDGRVENSNDLSVSIADRLRYEPVLVVLFAIVLTTTSLLVGLFQIDPSKRLKSRLRSEDDADPASISDSASNVDTHEVDTATAADGDASNTSTAETEAIEDTTKSGATGLET
ncbi:MAG: hypothetical protein AAFR45_02045 [Pseudomonadota bacterium]